MTNGLPVNWACFIFSVLALEHKNSCPDMSSFFHGGKYSNGQQSIADVGSISIFVVHCLYSALLGKKGNGKVSKNVLLSQNQGFDLQGISSFKISLDQRHYLSIQNVFQLWWKGIAYLWKKNLKHLLVENSFHSHLDGNTLEGGQKWFVRYKPILLKDNILQRYYMCLEVQELFLLK